MKNESATIEGTVDAMERMPNSTMGNPRWRVVIGGRFYCTSPNASLGYSISNHRGKRVRATVGTLRGVSTVFAIEVM